MLALLVITLCTVMVNALWLTALAKWPEFPLEYTIMATVVLCSLATILSGWTLVTHQ